MITVVPFRSASWSRALAGHPVSVEYDDGSRHPLPPGRWRAVLPGDDALLARAVGPALDLGCGPGRLAAALAQAGVPALGVDVSRHAVALARAAGAPALRRDVFAALPGEGRWACVLLADGNVGIGGDPERLLRRVRLLLARGGQALVETHPPTRASRRFQARLCAGGAVSGWFPWAHVAAYDLPPLASAAGLRVTTSWTEARRWFAVLSTG